MMEKLQMCRICLVENVRMYVVVNRSLQELYEKLTDIPFVTEDRRPILACFFCCTKLKQCCRLLRNCLEAEDQFAQMMNEDYEPNPLMNEDRLEFYSGFIKSPIEHISIVDECQTESIAIKEEFPAVCEGLDDIIEPKEEHQSDELESENVYYGCLDVPNISPQHSESDLEDDVPLLEFKIEVEEEEVSKKRRRGETKRSPGVKYLSRKDIYNVVESSQEPNFDRKLSFMEEILISKFCKDEDQKKDWKQKISLIKHQFKSRWHAAHKKKDIFKKNNNDWLDGMTSLQLPLTELEPENFDNSCLDVADLPPHCSESDFGYDVPLIEFQTEVEEEISKKKQRVRVMNRATLAKKPKLDARRIKLEDVTAEQQKKENSDTKVFRPTLKRTSKRRTYCKKSYKCEQRSFNQNSNLTNHIGKHTGEKPYKCDVCLRSFSRSNDLKKHILIHTGQRPYQCDVCQRSFSRNNYLIKHIRIHTGEIPYKCDICQRSFSRNNDLTKHILIHTGEKPYQCDVCQRSFTQKSSLSNHIGIHTGAKTYTCGVCQRSFSRNNDLTNHNLIHTSEKPYKCDVCQSSFSRNNYLTKHLRIHTGEKPYKCDVCQRCFTQNSSLTNHIRIHTGEKPYKCDVCQRSFIRNNDLTKHIRIHTGEKPYKCDVCLRSFSQKSNLTNHIRIHSDEKPYV